jgi:hypothetical protein
VVSGDCCAIECPTCSVGARKSRLAALHPVSAGARFSLPACLTRFTPTCDQDRIARIDSPLLALAPGAWTFAASQTRGSMVLL